MLEEDETLIFGVNWCHSASFNGWRTGSALKFRSDPTVKPRPKLWTKDQSSKKRQNASRNAQMHDIRNGEKVLAVNDCGCYIKKTYFD